MGEKKVKRNTELIKDEAKIKVEKKKKNTRQKEENSKKKRPVNIRKEEVRDVLSPCCQAVYNSSLLAV